MDDERTSVSASHVYAGKHARLVIQIRGSFHNDDTNICIENRHKV